MALFSVWGWGQHSITGFGSTNTYTQNFDNFRGTAATLPSEWSISGSYNSNAAYQVLTAGGTTPTTTTANGNNVYAGRAGTSSSDYSLLQKQATSGSASNITFSAVNNTASTINGFVINWNVEQFALGGRATQLNFRYRINGGSYTQTGITGATLYTSATGTTATNFAYVNSTPTGYSITISDLALAANQTVDFQFYVTNGSGSGSNSYVGIDDFSVYATQVNSNLPSFSVTGTFNNFSYVEGNGPSASQSVSVSGTNLDNSAVTVAAPTNYEVSLTNTNDFTDNKSIAYSGGTFTNQSVYVRLKSGLTSGSYTGSSLTISGGNASAANVALNGSVVPPPPANDLCSSATALTSGNTLTGSVVNATATSGLAASPTKKDVWYKYTALNSGNHVITANFASGVDLDIHIYTGACPASGSATFVGQTVGGTSEVLNANLVSGTDYYIRVIDYDENATTFTINLQEPLPCVAPAIVTNLNLTPTSSSIAGTFTANTASGYMVVLSTNSTLSSSPVNGIIYNVGDSFGGGTVIKYSAGATFTASNLNQSTNYHFFVFSYNTQCVGEPFYSTASLNGVSTTLAGPCVNESFSSNTRPNGWIDTDTGITYSSGYADMSVAVGSITTSALSNPSQLKFDLSRTTNATAKVLYVEVSTTSQTAGFTVVDTYNHSNTSSGSNNITVDLSAYSSNPTVYVRFRREQGNTSPWRIDNVQVFCATPIAGTTWTNSGWSNGTPSATVDAIISSNYSGSGFVAQNLTIDPTYTLTINNNETVTAGNVMNNGNIIVNDGGNFVQTTGGVYTSGTGASFITNRNSASVGGKYVFWSSPVANQNLYTAYSNGSSATAPTYVMTYDTATNLYPNVTNDNANFTNNAGKGYSVKVPANNATVAFGGGSQIPNNGTVNVALAGTSGGINNFNLIGNPYPSNIDLNAFYSANQSLLNSTFWFWDNTTGNVTTQTGNTSVNVGYATVNAADPAGNTWVEAPGTQTYNNTVLNATENIAKVGQGFIVKALDAGNVSFTNAMRSSSVGGTLNKNASSGKFWIKLTTSYGNTVTQAITYSQGASDVYDVYDSKAMGMGSDAFYSLVGAEKLVIQGKSTFHIDDVVQLGNKHFENGNFTISLSHKEGLFANGQDIYLHDKQTATYTNLQSGAYNFSANAGDFTNRFEIVYKLNVLSTNETEKGTFEVYRDGEDFVVRNNKNIQSVEVFDAAGRKVQQVTSNSKSVTVKVQAKGLYILKAISEGKEYTQKIIK